MKAYDRYLALKAMHEIVNQVQLNLSTSVSLDTSTKNRDPMFKCLKHHPDQGSHMSSQ